MAELWAAAAEYQGGVDIAFVRVPGHTRITAVEAASVGDSWGRRVEYHRTGVVEGKAMAKGLLPGGRSGYRWDVEPYDVRVVLESLSRRMWLQSLGLSPDEVQ